MPTKIRFYFLSLAVWLSAIGSAAAQTTPGTLPWTLPGQTVIGRTQGETGDADAIPFATLLSNLFPGQSANQVYAGPSSGSTALPAFRPLVNADLPTMPAAAVKCNPLAITANAQDCTIQGLVARGAPDANNDKLLIFDSAAGTLKFVTPGQIASSATAGVSSVGGLTGAIALGTGLTASGSTVNANIGSVENILPNVNWQQWTGLVPVVKQNSTGTAAQTPASCASFVTTNGNPTFTCSNTQQIKVGDLVVVATGASFTTQAYNQFWGFSGPNYINCASQVECIPTAGTTSNCASQPATCYVMAARVTGVVSNTSIAIQGNFTGVSPASSSATFLFPIVRGDTGVTTQAPDGWTKTSTLALAPDDFATHAYPGAIRPLWMKKGATGQEVLQWAVPQNQMARYQGQTLTCGVAVNQTVQGGANTWHIAINDNVNTGTSSAQGTGSSFGGYQFESVTHTIAQTATSIVVYISTDGNSGDVLYAALPTCAFVPSMVQSQLKQNAFERIRAFGHCNPPLLTPLIITFGTAIVPSTYWGWNSIDMEAISLGCYHQSLGAVWGKIEWTTTTVNGMIFSGTVASTTVPELIFGPQVITQVSGVTNAAAGIFPLFHDGTFALFSPNNGITPTSGTFDFWDAENTSPSSMN
jgi:hypothetical protein